jgi:hypothetical protein
MQHSEAGQGEGEVAGQAQDLGDGIECKRPVIDSKGLAEVAHELQARGPTKNDGSLLCLRE